MLGEVASGAHGMQLEDNPPVSREEDKEGELPLGNVGLQVDDAVGFGAPELHDYHLEQPALLSPRPRRPVREDI